MASNYFQSPISIDITNPIPVDAKYGPFSSVTHACTSIPSVLRFDGLTVQITGLGNYYWTQSDLTDIGLIPKYVSSITSATLNNLSTSGTNNNYQLSATTISGGTIYSGSTNLYSIFATIGSISSGGTKATTLNSWTASGLTYFADFNHNLGTNDYVIGTYLTTNGSEIIVDELKKITLNTLRVFVSDNTLSVRVILVSGGINTSGGTGNVSGPVSATDSNVALFDGTSGQLIKNSTVKIDSSGNTSVLALSASTIYSGSTNLYSIFAPLGQNILTSPYSASSINGSINTISGNNISSGSFSVVAGGQNNISTGDYSHSEGYQSSATGDSSHAEGYKTLASGAYAHAEGQFAMAIADYGAHAEGFFTTASGRYSHAEGDQTIASGVRSHAEGEGSIASGQVSHAQNENTIASGSYSHSEGYRTSASGNASHAEGYNSMAFGDYSHAGGQFTTGQGISSFAHSYNSNVVGDYSSILGGYKNKVNSLVTGSTILGGSSITATTSNTVYGVNFNASGSIISGNTNLYSIFAPYSKTATTLNSWSVSGSGYCATFVHGLGSSDYTINTYLTTTGYDIIVDNIQRVDSNTVRIYVSDNTLSIRVILKL